ncbi:MAG TPA: antibiotic biosynthesis monooxygenase [Gaiellaceae bacterium]|nr:antibiotic biosynthesis monooxygenase [Gaiellaceae bacterium]
MFARVARYKIPEENLDAAIGAFEQAVEELRDIGGNEGGYLLVDRDNSTAITLTFWTDRTALEASEVRASRLRSQAVGPHGGEIQAVDRCEVALDFSRSTRV